jgi:hypothetical protein
MTPTIEIIGVYRVWTLQRVHLIEVVVRSSTGVFDVSEFTQVNPSLPRANWQVAWDEQILDGSGERIIADGLAATDRPELWVGDVRLCFFMHSLDFDIPLSTPFGKVPLPRARIKPRRLSMVKYESPD